MRLPYHSDPGDEAASNESSAATYGADILNQRRRSDMPDPIKKQLIRQWDDLSPHELRTVHDLIDTFSRRGAVEKPL